MSLQKLYPEVQALVRSDKFRLLQFLASELAKEEGLECLEDGATYKIWTPLEAYDAAAALSKFIENEKETKE